MAWGGGEDMCEVSRKWDIYEGSLRGGITNDWACVSVDNFTMDSKHAHCPAQWCNMFEWWLVSDQNVTLGEEWEYDSNQRVLRMWVSLELDNKMSHPANFLAPPWVTQRAARREAGLQDTSTRQGCATRTFFVPVSLPFTFVHGHHDGKGCCVLKQLGLSCRRTDWEEEENDKNFQGKGEGER